MTKNSNTLLFLPENLRDSKVTPLFPHITDVFDQSLELAYYSEINKLRNLYNPASEYYDTDYILDLLGEFTLKNLLSDVTDKISLTMILSGIQNIKGTKDAFYAILKLLKINYKTIVFRTLANGCTEVTIVFDLGERINLTDIALLDQFSKEIFPLCLDLTGITNCTVYDSSNAYNGYNTVDLGVHYLDNNFLLDMSRLDTGYGVIDTSVSNTIALLLCNNTTSDLNAVLTLPIYTLSTNVTESDLFYAKQSQTLLDYSLTLDYFNPINYSMFSTNGGRSTSHIFTYSSSVNFIHKQQHISIYVFTLDVDNLDNSEFRPLDGYQPYKYISNALDNNLILDNVKLDVYNTITINNTSYSSNHTISYLNTVGSFSSNTKHNSFSDSLDYSKLSESQFLPALTV